VHELALCGSIADIVERRAPEGRVETIRLRIGQLRQVVPETLEYCWRVVTDATQLEGSVLEIERVAARLRCTACAGERDMGDEPQFGCPACGDPAASTVVAGEEFMITSMDVMPDSVPS
jgi:hydrogenase nickel incorporation protein HypA/HybF